MEEKVRILIAVTVDGVTDFAEADVAFGNVVEAARSAAADLAETLVALDDPED